MGVRAITSITLGSWHGPKPIGGMRDLQKTESSSATSPPRLISGNRLSLSVIALSAEFPLHGNYITVFEFMMPSCHIFVTYFLTTHLQIK
jgi:hypothetical protein